jgi:hypothetical protein
LGSSVNIHTNGVRSGSDFSTRSILLEGQTLDAEIWVPASTSTQTALEAEAVSAQGEFYLKSRYWTQKSDIPIRNLNINNFQERRTMQTRGKFEWQDNISSYVRIVILNTLKHKHGCDGPGEIKN